MKRSVLSILAVSAVLAFAASASQAQNGITVNAGSALEGTFGAQVTIANNSSNTFVSSDHPTDETHFLVRWRMSLGGMTINQGAPINNNYFRMMHLNKDGEGAHVVFFVQRVPDTGNLHFVAWSKESSGAGNYRFVGGFFHQAYQGNPAFNQIECEWWRATSASSNDGRLHCRKLGTGGSEFDTTNLDNFNTEIDQVRAGFFAFDTFTGTGTYKFDGYESYR